MSTQVVVDAIDRAVWTRRREGIDNLTRLVRRTVVDAPPPMSRLRTEVYPEAIG